VLHNHQTPDDIALVVSDIARHLNVARPSQRAGAGASAG
jgi:hypothetical protein